MSSNIPGFGNLYSAQDPVQQDSLLAVQRGGEMFATHLSNVYAGIVNYYLWSNNVGTMAYETSSDYSPIRHDHDCYTYSECSSVPFSGYTGKTRVAKFKDAEIYIPNQYVDHSEERKDILKKLAPKIGTLKFFSSADFPVTDYTSSAFEGWVRPNGKSYNLSDFKLSAELAAVYGTQSGQFAVPTVDRFLRMTTLGGLTQVEGRNACGAHTHMMSYSGGEINVQSIGEISVDRAISCITTSGGGLPPFAIHHGYGNPNSSKKLHDEYGERTQIASQTIENMLMPGCNTPAELSGAAGITAGETHPPYDDVPVLIYIGKSKYSQNEYIR